MNDLSTVFYFIQAKRIGGAVVQLGGANPQLVRVLMRRACSDQSCRFAGRPLFPCRAERVTTHGRTQVQIAWARRSIMRQHIDTVHAVQRQLSVSVCGAKERTFPLVRDGGGVDISVEVFLWLYGEPARRGARRPFPSAETTSGGLVDSSPRRSCRWLPRRERSYRPSPR